MHSSHIEIVKHYWDNDLMDDMGMSAGLLSAAMDAMPWFPYAYGEVHDKSFISIESKRHGYYRRLWKEQQDRFANWLGKAMSTMSREDILDAVDFSAGQSMVRDGVGDWGMDPDKFFTELDSCLTSIDPKLKAWVRGILEHHGHPGEVEEVLDGWYDSLTEVLAGGGQ